ncbi:MAG: hypothetical protein JWO42_2745, partial [Chloroflexi bacterium]|nr:hypothetical protein [Chloroflexota bacterium]
FVLWQAGGALLSEAREQRNNESTMHRVFQALPAGIGWWAVFGIVLVFLVWSARTDFLYIVLLVAGLYALLARVRQDDPEPQAALLLAIVGIAVLFAGDFAYLRDVFDNSPLYRMNTVFKLMYQAWILLAIAAPFSVFLIGKSLRKLQSRVPYIVWYASAVVLAVGLAVYPIEGVASQAPAMPSPSTLDGLQYVRDVAPHEYAAINWVRQHTAPTDVVAEAYGGDYWVSGLDSSPNKMSALSGRPTLIGWPGSHEALWRGDFGGGADAVAAGAMLTQREGDVRTLYTSTDAQTAIKLIRQYRIAYVYVGPFEQTTYGGSPAGLQKFKTFLVPVVQFPYVTLYKVPASLLKG